MKAPFLLSALILSPFINAQLDGIYVSDAGNFQDPPWQIMHYALDGSDPTTFIDTALDWPQDILFVEDSNRVLISNFGTGTITEYAATTGAYLGNFATGISGPTRMKYGPDGSLYVLQWYGNGRVRRYGPSGLFLGEFTTMGVPQSIGLDWDGDGNLYVSSYEDDLVRKFDPQGNDLGVFINTNLVGPTNIWFDANGDLLVADYDGGAVKRFDPEGNYVGIFVNGLWNVEGVAVLPDGSFLLGNGGTSSVKRYTATGVYVEDIVPSGSGGLMTPNAVVVRGVPPNGVKERNGPAAVTVNPRVGRSFRVEGPAHDLIQSMTVHSTTGELVDRIQGNTWIASGVAAGPYVVVVELLDGTRSSDRIEVIGR